MKKRPPTAEWSLSIDDQSIDDNGHLTHYNMTDANYTKEKH